MTRLPLFLCARVGPLRLCAQSLDARARAHTQVEADARARESALAADRKALDALVGMRVCEYTRGCVPAHTSAQTFLTFDAFILS